MKEFIMYYVDRPKNLAEFIKTVGREFPDVPFERLEIIPGIIFITIRVKQ